jgi:signal peptidase I
MIAVIAVLLVIIGLLVVRHFALQVVTVSGDSMEPALQSGDRVLLDKITFRTRSIERGDIVVVEPPTGVIDGSTNNVKRVIAFGGESVSIENGGVSVNGVPLDEPYARGESASAACVRENPCVVPDGHVFVMGDNRLVSADSRTFGPIPADRIAGLVAARVWPPGRIGPV